VNLLELKLKEMKLLKFNLHSYLMADTQESLMRLLSFIGVVTTCLFVISLMFYIIYSAINKFTINLMEVAACISAAATLSGVFVAGKVYQKKIEVNDNPSIPSVMPDGRQILND